MIKIKCKICNTPFFVKLSQINRRKTCSLPCKSKLYSKMYSFNGNPNFKNSQKYVMIHKWLRKVYGNGEKCDFCGISSTRKSGKWNLQYALRKEKTYEKKRINFLMLCCKCHQKYDRKDHPTWKKRNSEGQRKRFSDPKNHPQFGKKLKKETCEKIGKANFGKKRTLKQKEIMRKSHLNSLKNRCTKNKKWTGGSLTWFYKNRKKILNFKILFTHNDFVNRKEFIVNKLLDNLKSLNLIER